jgi:DHA1 family inner membrane transport protein
MNLSLLALFLAAFTYGTAEFVIAGVLPEVAEGLGISIPVAGILVTAYAAGIAIGGPALALMTNHIPRKRLIVALTGIFTLGQAVCAIAPNFEILLATRIFVSALHGTYFGIAAVVALSLVPPDRRGFAVALVLAGLTLSNVIGVPLGTVIGNEFGWRATFWAVAGLGLAATVIAVFALPANAGASAPRPAISREFRALGRQQVVLSLLIALLVMIGQYSLFTYIAPLLREVTGIEQSMVPFMLMLYGIGATAGALLGGRLADWKLLPALVIILFLQSVTFVALIFISPNAMVMAVGLIVWGGINFAFGSPLQTRILQWAADGPNLASTLIPAAFNVGIAIGAALGGGLIEMGIGYRDLPWLGAVCSLAAVAVALISIWMERKGAQQPPALEMLRNPAG